MGTAPLLKYLRGNHGDVHIPILLFKLLNPFVKLCQAADNDQTQRGNASALLGGSERNDLVIDHLQPDRSCVLLLTCLTPSWRPRPPSY